MIRHSPADRRLLAALARILRLIDPVPADVVAAAEALRAGPAAAPVDPASVDPREHAGRRAMR